MIQSSLYAFFLQQNNTKVLIVENDKEAQSAFHLAQFCYQQGISKLKPVVLPDFRARMGDDIRSFFEEFMQLLCGLRLFYENENTFLIAPVSSVLYRLPKKELLQGFFIAKNDLFDLNELKEKLINFGYEAVDIIEMEGEVSFRGDIIDISVPYDKSYRVSFFDIECESIREFDIKTQKSNPSELDKIFVPPALFNLSDMEYEDLMQKVLESEFDTFSKDLISLGFWFLDDLGIKLLDLYPSIITPQAQGYAKEIFEFDLHDAYGVDFFMQLPLLQEISGYEDIQVDAKNLDYFLELNSGKEITILVPTELLKERFLLKGLKVICTNLVVNIALPKTFIISLNTYPKHKGKQRPKIAVDELNIGEYVVHKDYGVGIFRGIEQAKILGFVRDFIRIDYQGEDSLLLPVENLNFIDRYIAGSNTVPLIDRLGKGNFLKLKEKVKSKLFEIADSIVALAAKRNLIEGKKIDTSFPEIEIFQKQSGFDLTVDQEKSIREIFYDLSSGKVMDRLLSGDVGFGKTEVALNAIFAVCRNRFQTLMVVPTTLLAMQHFNTLKTRLPNFRVVKLDRFIKTSEKQMILKDLENGAIDVVVGTHSVLQATFKNLGLIVIDEEHKFGVKQKEAIKSLSKDVHLLSMSATPIPRTLNMALSQIKGMSQLLTPPSQRIPTKTFVKEKSGSLIKEVILRELRRNGQIFYIHNNIANIPIIKNELSYLLPQLKIAVLHSKIESKLTEEIMLDFAQNKYHLLLCTSIVESGIHLPNANTIIIDGADHFGLADLHQLRGRVGRGDKEGFCYYLIEDKAEITQEATKRLLALEKNSFLGSGAMIAYQDLEIRGGGNLLGEAQSGHIKNIGYSLYLKMLEDAIYQLSGKQNENIENDVELKLQVSAYLNSDLISSDTLRLELYRRLSFCKNTDDVYAIELEIQDRFGNLDLYTKRFLLLILIKVLARENGIVSISSFKEDVSFIFLDGTKKFIKAADEDEMLANILSFLHNKCK